MPNPIGAASPQVPAPTDPVGAPTPSPLGAIGPVSPMAMPGGATGNTGSPGPGPAPVTGTDPIVAHHEAAKAAHDKVGYAVTQLREARGDLDKLVGMGDSVTDEDVLQSMAKWTANGADPKGLIALMAGNPANGQPPMPSGGEALKGWLADHDAQMKQMEQQLNQVHEQTGQQLGTAALRVLASDHINRSLQARGRNFAIANQSEGNGRASDLATKGTQLDSDLSQDMQRSRGPSLLSNPEDFNINPTGANPLH